MLLNDDNHTTRKFRFRRAGARCPRCGYGPALRFHPLMRHISRHADRDIVLFTYQCHRRGCGEVYGVSVRDIMREN